MVHTVGNYPMMSFRCRSMSSVTRDCHCGGIGRRGVVRSNRRLAGVLSTRTRRRDAAGLASAGRREHPSRMSSPSAPAPLLGPVPEQSAYLVRDAGQHLGGHVLRRELLDRILIVNRRQLEGS